MPEQRDATWTKLVCSCGCAEFLTKFHLNYKPGGGTSTTQAGYRCRDCQADVDVAGLVRVLERRLKKEELAALQRELANAPEEPIGPGRRL